MKTKTKQRKLGVREATYEKFSGFANATHRKISDVADLAITKLMESDTAPAIQPATVNETQQAQPA